MKSDEELPESRLTSQEPAQPPSAGSLFFRADRKLIKVQTEEILYVESLKDYVRIVTRTAKPLVVKQTISTVEVMLPARQFMRIHRSFIVAVSGISSYTPRHVGIGGQEIPIGRLYQKDVERMLGVSN